MVDKPDPQHVADESYGSGAALDEEAFLAGAYKRPRTLWVWLALILALAMLIPWLPLMAGKRGGPWGAFQGVAAALGAEALVLVLAVIGLIRIRRKKLRGTGLAVVALLFAVFGGFVNTVSGVMQVTQYMSRRADDAMKLLQTSRRQVDERSSRWRSEFAAPGLRDAVGDEDVAVWLRAVLDQQGQLQRSEKAKQFMGPSKTTRDAVVFHYSGHFVNGLTSVDVSVSLAPGNPKPVINNIRVGELSLRPEADRARSPQDGPIESLEDATTPSGSPKSDTAAPFAGAESPTEPS